VVIATEDIEAFNDDERFSCGNYWNDWDEESDMEDGHIKSSSFPYSGQGVENSMAVDMEVDSDLANKMAGIDVDDDEEEDVVSFEEFAGVEPILLGTSPEACESTENAEKIASRSASPIGSKLEKHACSSNEIKLKQDLILLFYFDNMPAKFNRVLGEEVDADIAIQCLNHMIELHMSETEGDDFCALMDRIVTKSTGKFFPMPIRSKTLTRDFLGKTDVFFPLAISKISILPQIFGTGEKADLLPLCKPFIKLEDALSSKCVIKD